MIAGVRKEDYTGENAYVFDELMAMCASEAQAMALTGVECPFGKTHWLMTLHITGDWPWLHKSAGFSRSFNNALKQRHQSRQNGICHECLAGTPEYPFEQVGTRRPLWLTTAYQGADPFIHPSVFQIAPCDQQILFVLDLGYVSHVALRCRESLVGFCFGAFEFGGNRQHHR